MPRCWCPCLGKSSDRNADPSDEDPPESVELDFRHSNLLEVPAKVFMQERTLQKLSLASNQINSLPPSLFHCHELRELELYDNEIQSIPAAIGSLTRLTRLDVSRNAITEVADNIKSCKSLAHVNLSLNHLVKVPDGISQLVGLEELNLTDTCLEYLSANFGRLSKLRVLELRENVLQSLPKSMTRFTHLTRLDLGHNDLHDIPDVIQTMTNLTELFVDNNAIRSIPKFIGNLTKLTSLDISNNDVYEVAEEICKCVHLTDLNLSSNNMSGLPDGLGQLTALNILRIDSNTIQYLPERFGQLKNLEELTATRNSLKALPPSIGLLRKLHTLLLDKNDLKELPKEIGSCSSLSVLHLGKNRLRSLPAEIGHLTLLRVLSVPGNSLQNLPVSILNIQKLGAIWLSPTQSDTKVVLNEEIDTTTGKRVLTCFLLPQVTLDEEPKWAQEDEDAAENSAQARHPTVRFDEEIHIFQDGKILDHPSPGTSQPPRSHGLTRAPTPYPKELRALAKHAAHVSTRQVKDINGDISMKEGATPTEGDVKADTNPPGYSGGASFQKANGSRDAITLTRGLDVQQPTLPLQHPSQDMEARHTLYDSIRRLRLTQGTSGQEPTGAASSDATMGRDSQGAVHPDVTLAKSPPPYHIAAQRAAFFRTASVGSAVNGNPLPSHHPESQHAFQGRGSGGSNVHPNVESVPPSSTTTPPESESLQKQVKVLEMNFAVGVATKTHHPLNKTYTVEEERGDGDNTLRRTRIDYRSSNIPTGGTIVTDPIPENTLAEDQEAMDEGPPIIPMRPIVRNYTAQRPAVTTILQRGGNPSNYPTPGTMPTNAVYKGSESVKRHPIPMVGSYGLSPSPSQKSISDDTRIGIPHVEPTPKVTTKVQDVHLMNTKLPTTVSTPQDKVTPGGPAGPMLLAALKAVDKDKASMKPSSIPTPRSSFGKGGVQTTPQYQRPPSDCPSVTPTPPTPVRVTSLGTKSHPPVTPKKPSFERRNSGGSRIPMRVAPTPSPPPHSFPPVLGEKGHGQTLGVAPKRSVGDEEPSKNAPKKPWVFGTHKNKRVMPVEAKIINSRLGFTVSNSGEPDLGAFVETVEDPDSELFPGDKVLQVDGIQVEDKGIEIIRKVLSNCVDQGQDSILLLVSKQT